LKEYVVEVNGLRKTFGEFVAVDGISFYMLPGECFGILGPNGAGKTTTIRMMYGLSPITAGSLNVFGLDISQNWRTIRSRIGVCHQENTLDPDLTVKQNLAVFARYFDIPKREATSRTQELLEFISLKHRMNAKVSELSGGMVRRLMLARSLINNPELLILDEPTTGLDPQSRHQVWERLENLKLQGITVLLTTHYMDEASRMCDRLVIMDHGRILVEGTPMDLIQTYVGKEIIEIISPSNELRKYIQSESLDYEDVGHRLVIHSQKGDALFRQISGHYCKEGCILRMATLEDVFLKLTGRELRE